MGRLVGAGAGRGRGMSAGKAGKAAGVGDAVGAHIIQTPRYVLDKADVVFSGIQPTGVLHLGNYLGAVATWLRLQEQIGAEVRGVNVRSPLDPDVVRLLADAWGVAPATDLSPIYVPVVMLVLAR